MQLTIQDIQMTIDALRWFSDQQERAREGMPKSEVTVLGASFDKWRRRIADELEELKEGKTSMDIFEVEVHDWNDTRKAG